MKDTLESTVRTVLTGLLTRSSYEIKLPLEKPSTGLRSIFREKVPDVVRIDSTMYGNGLELYHVIRDSYLGNLQYLEPDTPAEKLFVVYADIARHARQTLCSYQGTEAGKQLVRDYVFYDSRIRPWNQLFPGSRG